MFYSQVSSILFFCFFVFFSRNYFSNSDVVFTTLLQAFYPVWDKAGGTFHKKPGLELEVENKNIMSLLRICSRSI